MEQGRSIRGYCSRPWDCYTCPLFQEEVSYETSIGTTALWVCPDCASDVIKEARANGKKAKLPGFYGEGYCQRPECQRPLHASDPAAARYSIMLQIVTIRSRE